MADPAKSCCNSNKVFNTLTTDSAIPCDTNSHTQFSDENSGEDHLHDTSLEDKNIERKEPPLNEKLTKVFQDLIWNNTKPEKVENLLKSVLPAENVEGLEQNKARIEIWRTMSHKTKSADLKLQNMQLLCKSPFQ